MVAYRPLLATFVITFPILIAMLHTSTFSAKKRILWYYGLGTLFVLSFAACILLTVIEIYNAEHRVLVFTIGTYFVFILNFLNLSMGALAAMEILDEEEEAYWKHQGQVDD